MGGLSTFFGRGEAAAPQPPRRVAPGETADALDLLLTFDGHPPEADHLRHFTQFAAERGIDLGEIWVVPRGKRLIAACLPVLAAGRSGLILSSMPVNDPALARVAAGCCEAAAGSLAPRTSMLQMLLEPAERHFAEALSLSGFSRLATLIYLQKSVRAPESACPLRDYKLARYGPATHERFARVIDATYAGSLDCPALHGRRDIEDVIAGHMSSGAFDPNLWFVLGDGKTDLGVLLLAPLPGQETMEIVYIGLVPAARGRRLGDLLVEFA
ncbi:MAG TPA: hypothetical protein VF624_08530, partial [Tepidisphaeraceae bacterium]